MSRSLTLVLEGDPRPAPRHRHNAGGHGGHKPLWYTQQLEAYGLQALVQRNAQQASVLTGRVGVDATFYRATNRTADVDNLQKTLYDALKGIAWKDDSQIDEAHTRVVRGVGDIAARVEARVYALSPDRPLPVPPVRRGPGWRIYAEAAALALAAAQQEDT